MSRTNHHGDKKKERLGFPWRFFMTTPSWWTNMKMNRPIRHKGSTWERNTVKTAIKDLDGVDKPSVSKKPHHYWW